MSESLTKKQTKGATNYEQVKRLPEPSDSSVREVLSEKTPIPSVELIESESKSRTLNAVSSPPAGKIHIQPVSHPSKDTLLSSRYELKYRISESKAQAIREYIRNYLPMDRYARSHPDGQYPISSLYLDSDTLDLCRETLVGKANRFKLRIRAYDDAPSSPAFFEIKRRANKIVLKSRARVERKDLRAVFENPFMCSCRSGKDRKALEQFAYYKQAIQGKPVVLVRYMREPFEDDTDNRVRITFDRQLSYREMPDPEVFLNGNGWQPIPIPFVILEIKFTGRYPGWLHELIRVFNLNISSMSKYAASVRHSRHSALQKAFPYYLD